MSMTYADTNPTIAPVDGAGRTTDDVFVPRYAQRRHKSNKPVKTWMIIAPIGVLAVIGTAAALMMGGGEQPAPATPSEAPSALAQPMQTAPAALETATTPAAQPAPVQATPLAEPASTPRRAEPAPRRAAPAAAAAERPVARVETPAEPTGPQPYSAPATPALNTAPAASAPTSVQIQPPPTVSVQPLN